MSLNNNTPSETPSFAELQTMAKVAAATEELNEQGIQCVAGFINEETGKMHYTTPGLEALFEDNPGLHQALEHKLRTLFQLSDDSHPSSLT